VYRYLWVSFYSSSSFSLISLISMFGGDDESKKKKLGCIEDSNVLYLGGEGKDVDVNDEQIRYPFLESRTYWPLDCGKRLCFGT
jgi:hypothetical protein